MNEQQLSLEDVETLSNISEIERTTTTVKEKIRFATPMKKCTKCGELKPLSEYYYRKNGKLRADCKSCLNRRRDKWREEHLEESKAYSREYSRRWREEHRGFLREQNFLYSRHTRYKTGYLLGTGICMICGETNPLVLVEHHLFPWDDEFILTLCANCHEKHRARNREKHMRIVLNTIENSKFLWSDIDEEDIRVDFNPEIGEESPLVEVLVG